MVSPAALACFISGCLERQGGRLKCGVVRDSKTPIAVEVLIAACGQVPLDHGHETGDFLCA